MKTLILQGANSAALSHEALDTFKVACSAQRIRLLPGAAYLTEVRDDAETRKAVTALAQYWQLDAALVDPALKLADFRLIAFDMDSTLINIESLDEVAALAGKGAEVAAITEAAMRGEIADYSASLRQRVALLKGVDAALLQRVLDHKLRLNDGAEALVHACQQAGLKTLIATGGFTFFASAIQNKLRIDLVRANQLEIIDGQLSGQVSGPAGGPIIDAEGKAQAVREACTLFSCKPQQVIAVGDGANDLKMMALAGLSVAYRAKPVVRAQASQALNVAPLSGILHWFNN